MNQRLAERLFDHLKDHGFKSGEDLSIARLGVDHFVVSVTPIGPSMKRRLLEANSVLRTCSYEHRYGTYTFRSISFKDEVGDDAP